MDETDERDEELNFNLDELRFYARAPGRWDPLLRCANGYMDDGQLIRIKSYVGIDTRIDYEKMKRLLQQEICRYLDQKSAKDTRQYEDYLVCVQSKLQDLLKYTKSMKSLDKWRVDEMEGCDRYLGIPFTQKESVPLSSVDYELHYRIKELERMLAHIAKRLEHVKTLKSSGNRLGINPRVQLIGGGLKRVFRELYTDEIVKGSADEKWISEMRKFYFFPLTEVKELKDGDRGGESKRKFQCLQSRKIISLEDCDRGGGNERKFYYSELKEKNYLEGCGRGEKYKETACTRFITAVCIELQLTIPSNGTIADYTTQWNNHIRRTERGSSATCFNGPPPKVPAA